MPITNRAPLAQISPANTNTCLTQEGAAVGCSGANDLVPTLRPTGKVTYFRIATTDSHQGPAGADYLYKTKGYKKVYVIDDTTTYGVGIADAFSNEWKTNGGTVLGRSSEPDLQLADEPLKLADDHSSSDDFVPLGSDSGVRKSKPGSSGKVKKGSDSDVRLDVAGDHVRPAAAHDPTEIDLDAEQRSKPPSSKKIPAPPQVTGEAWRAGRIKHLRPIYVALARRPDTRALAAQLCRRHRIGSVARLQLERMLRDYNVAVAEVIPLGIGRRP